MIKLSNISFSYQDKKIFHDMSHVFEKSSVLMGKNGGGKSTLFKIMAGIQKPTHGSMSSNIRITWQPATSHLKTCLLYTSPSPRDGLLSRMPSSA